MPVAITSPGIYSQDGSGHGRGYILHQDGTLKSPSNPPRPSDKVTIFATGMDPMAFTECCAATDTPVDVFIDNFYCQGVAAVAGWSVDFQEVFTESAYTFPIRLCSGGNWPTPCHRLTNPVPGRTGTCGGIE